MKRYYKTPSRVRERSMKRYERLKAEGRCTRCGRSDHYTAVRHYTRCEVCQCASYGGTKAELEKLRRANPKPKGERQGVRGYYTVYERKTDLPVCFGKAKECAAFLGIKLASFYSAISRAKHGVGKYDFLKEALEDVENENEGVEEEW